MVLIRFRFARVRAGTPQTDAPRDAKGRFGKGHSGNPKGRPPGIRNPRRRPLGLLLRQARPGTLAPLIQRKRYLRLPVLQFILPPARQPDPGELLGIDFSRMRSADQIAAAIAKILAAIGHGEIAPSEGLRLVRRSRKPLRAMRRRLWRDLAHLEAMRRSSPVPPPRRGGEPAPDPIRGGARSAAEGAEPLISPHAPSTMLRMVPLPRVAGEEQRAGEFHAESRRIPCSEGISAAAAPAGLDEAEAGGTAIARAGPVSAAFRNRNPARSTCWS